jgi:hypothetical protein
MAGLQAARFLGEWVGFLCEKEGAKSVGAAPGRHDSSGSLLAARLF